MKTTLKRILITILFLANMDSLNYAQGKTEPAPPKIIYLLEGNEKKEIVLPVLEQYKFLILQITADASEGEIIIEIFDPSGEKRKKFSLNSELNPDKKIKGLMAYQPFDKPLKGNWIIKINSKNAKGSFVLGTSLNLYSEYKLTKTISGTVTDANNKPLWGAIILDKGTTIGTVTDKSGNFSINVPDNAEYLLFYAGGMKTQEVKMGDQIRFTITLNQ